MNTEVFKDLVVLYVEDQKDTQEELEHIFNKTFKKAIIANNGDEGLKKFLMHKKRAYDIDIVVTDITMPKLNGLDMIKEIKKVDSNVKFVLTTAYTDESYLLEAIELGVTAYITKPINIIQLLEKIEFAYKEKLTKGKIHEITEKLKNHNFNSIDDFLNSFESKEEKKEIAEKIILSEGFSYNYKNKVLEYNDNIISLVNQEILLLEYFIEHKNDMISYEELLEAISINSNTSLNNLRTVIKSIRKKTSKTLIKNLSGIGYQMLIEGK